MANVEIVIDAVDNASKVFEGVGNVMSGALKVGLAAGVAGFAALAAGAGVALSAAMDNEKLQAQLAQTIKATGGAAGLTADAANDLAVKFRNLAGGSDDAILAIETIGLRAGTISANEMPAFIQTTLDLGAVMGSTEGAATLLARAQEDVSGAVGKAMRAGIIFTDAQKDQIKKLEASGDKAGALKIFMDRLAEATSGAAAAQAGTLAGKWEILKGNLGEAAETIGGALLPVASQLFDKVIAPAIPVIEELAQQLTYFFEALAGGDAQSAFDVLYEGFDILSNAFPGLRDGIQSAQEAFGNLPSTLASAQQALQPVIDAARNLAAAFIESMPMIQAQVGAAFTFVQNLIATVMPTIVANVTTALNALAEFWRAHGEQIMTVIRVAFEVIVVVVGGALTLLSGLIAAALQLINGDWSGAWQTIQDTAATFMNSVLSLVGTNLEDFLATWRGVFEMLLTIISVGFERAVGAAQAIVTGFVDVGRAIIDGLVSGIKGAAGHLIDAARGAVSDAIAAAKALLGIHSPSTVFMGIGANMMTGMAMGISGASYLPAQATANAAYSSIYSIGAINVNGAQNPVATATAVRREIDKLGMRTDARRRTG